MSHGTEVGGRHITLYHVRHLSILRFQPAPVPQLKRLIKVGGCIVLFRNDASLRTMVVDVLAAWLSLIYSALVCRIFAFRTAQKCSLHSCDIQFFFVQDRNCQMMITPVIPSLMISIFTAFQLLSFGNGYCALRTE